MTSTLSLQTNRLTSQLKLYSQKKFTGRLDIEIGQTQTWSFYLSLGRFTWASGGIHPIRRWYRQVARYCSQVNLKAIPVPQREPDDCWDYTTLTLLAKRQIAKTDEVMAVIHGTVTEILFDMMQTLELAVSSQQRDCQIHPRLGSRPSTTDASGILPRTWTLDVEDILLRTEQAWEKWCQRDCRIYSPNATLVILKPQQLQEQVALQAYQNIMAIANNQRALRDIAIVKNLDLVKLMRSLFPYIKQELIAFHMLPDLPIPDWVKTQDAGTAGTAASESLILSEQSVCIVQHPTLKKKPLVICIDKSAHSYSQMYRILTQADYDCMGIQDALQALSILIKCQPDLIFIDLLMPITNGYEMCAQIRRMQQFQEIPIILMAESVSLVDRVRGKMVQASDFLLKSTMLEQTLGIVEKFKLKEKNIELA